MFNFSDVTYMYMYVCNNFSQLRLKNLLEFNYIQCWKSIPTTKNRELFESKQYAQTKIKATFIVQFILQNSFNSIYEHFFYLITQL